MKRLLFGKKKISSPTNVCIPATGSSVVALDQLFIERAREKLFAELKKENAEEIDWNAVKKNYCKIKIAQN